MAFNQFPTNERDGFRRRGLACVSLLPRTNSCCLTRAQRRPVLIQALVLFVIFAFVGFLQSAHAADLSKAKQDYATGEYLACLSECTEAVEAGVWNEEWYRLKIDVEMTLGKYEAAMETMQVGFGKYATSIHLRWRGYRILRMNNMPDEAEEMLKSIDPTVRSYPWRFSDASNRVIVGRFELEMGADARQVLSSHYDKAKELSPRFVPAFQASAELALSKYDYAMAAKELQQALTIDEDNADLHFMLAKSFAPSDAEKAQASLDRAIELNPNHVDALLWSADMAIDGERYTDAKRILNDVEAINPHHPSMWSYRAVIAHLAGDFETEAKHRETALRNDSKNPAVDNLIGRKLAQKYRFKEGAEYQRRALEFNPDYLPAKFQLSQDLLRLGEDDEGWQLAEEVNRRDGYNVVAHNLVALREQLNEFRTIERSGIVLRMSALEAELYGERTMRLLESGKEVLGEKYETDIDKPVVVEIFPEQKDFAIRTFGLPGGQGFLGVCFGRVITANSPASQGTHPSNWEATLWHEFCHVVTLEKTNNRMPRWLSEGISVYEERLAGPGWGQTMNSQYREMIIDGKLVPVSNLSDAFLHPKTAMDLQFAYYQSSLVVEYLIEEYGLEILNNILTDLGVGMPINDSLKRYTGSLDQLNEDFETYARDLAGEFAKDADWSELNLPENVTRAGIEEWLKVHPNHLDAMRELANRCLEDEDYPQAATILEQIIALYDGEIDSSVDHMMLSVAYREQGSIEDEKRALEDMVAQVADASDAHRRLLEIGRAESDWEAVFEQSQRLLAIDPLVPYPHIAAAESASALNRPEEALLAYRALLRFRTADVADCHYQMAKLAAELGDWRAANRSILLAIEEAPRFRDAYTLYREIREEVAKLPEITPARETPSTDGLGGDVNTENQ